MNRQLIIMFWATLGFCSTMASQNHYGQLKKFAAIHYEIDNNRLSEDGELGSYEKKYEKGADTLMLYQNEGKTIIQTALPKSKAVFLLEGRRALIQYRDSTVFRDLKNKAHTTFRESGTISNASSGNGFIIHYKESPEKDLVVYDEGGQEVKRLKNCQQFVQRSSDLYAVAKKDEGYVICKMDDRTSEIIYKSTEAILRIESPKNTEGLLIWKESSTGVKVSFYDYTTKVEYKLNDLPENFDEFYIMDNPERDVFIISAQKQLVPEQKMPDIWYGEDVHLEHKFNIYNREKTLLWEPRRNIISLIESESYPQSFSMGSARYFLMYNEEKDKNYTFYNTPLHIAIYDRLTKRTEDLGVIGKEMIIDPKGKYLVYQTENRWKIYDVETGKTVWLDEWELETAYFTPDSKIIYFCGKGGMWKYVIRTGRLIKIVNTPGMSVQVLNSRVAYLLSDYIYFHRTVDDQLPILVRLENEKSNTTAIGVIEKGHFEYLIPETEDRIDEVRMTKNGSDLSFRRQNYRMPPELNLMRKNRSYSRIRNTTQDKELYRLKQEVINYENQEHVLLKGILYYPIDFDPTKKYPMITEIYEEQNHYRNKFLQASFLSPRGSNIRLFIEEGYFVFLPDIAYSEKGPGLSALDCVDHALDAVLRNENIDANRTALMGHSFGGYETNFIATHSDRFKTYISGNGHSDIVHTYFNFAENFTTPNYMAFENGQYRMNGPFAENKDLYFDNNPIYEAENVQAPVLLWAGMRDDNVDWHETRNFYNALKRNGKKVVSLFYREEGHTLHSAENQTDLTVRILEWLDYYLKDEGGIEWIHQKK